MHRVQITDKFGNSKHLTCWRNFILDLQSLSNSSGLYMKYKIDRLVEYNCIYTNITPNGVFLDFDTIEDFIHFQLVWS